MAKKSGKNFTIYLIPEELALVREIQQQHSKAISKLFVQFLRERQKLFLHEKAKKLIASIIFVSVEKNRRYTPEEIYEMGGGRENLRVKPPPYKNWSNLTYKLIEIMKNASSPKEIKEVREACQFTIKNLPEILLIKHAEGRSEEWSVEYVTSSLYLAWAVLLEEEKNTFIDMLYNKKFYLNTSEGLVDIFNYAFDSKTHNEVYGKGNANEKK